ncbi:MAG TPA: hypothetical protein HPQ00_16200, partial [Magnetococcales bacterium]|nr:hypothetical protein [Magnetococcales bacterium]
MAETIDTTQDQTATDRENLDATTVLQTVASQDLSAEAGTPIDGSTVTDVGLDGTTQGGGDRDSINTAVSDMAAATSGAMGDARGIVAGATETQDTTAATTDATAGSTSSAAGTSVPAGGSTGTDPVVAAGTEDISGIGVPSNMTAWGDLTEEVAPEPTDTVAAAPVDGTNASVGTDSVAAAGTADISGIGVPSNM